MTGDDTYCTIPSEALKSENQSKQEKGHSANTGQGVKSFTRFNFAGALLRSSSFLPTVDCCNPPRFDYRNKAENQQQYRDHINHTNHSGRNSKYLLTRRYVQPGTNRSEHND